MGSRRTIMKVAFVTVFLSLAFQCTSYTVTKMLLCISSSLTILSLNKMKQIQSENLKQKRPI